MGQPIPGVGISTPYGKRGPYWSCNANSSGGIHTGADFACPKGTRIVAPIAGQIRHRSYGSAFGNHQFAISPDPGQPFEDGEVFFAHTTDRPPDGAYVRIGDPIAHVGAEGNVSGPHLHMEYHPTSKNVWSCSVHANPQPVLDHGGSTPPPPSTGDCTTAYPAPTSGLVYLSKLRQGQRDSDSVWYLQRALNGHSLAAPGNVTLPLTGCFLDQTATVTKADQQQHGFGDDPMGSVFLGPAQAEHLFAGSGLTIINDL